MVEDYEEINAYNAYKMRARSGNWVISARDLRRHRQSDSNEYGEIR